MKKTQLRTIARFSVILCALLLTANPTRVFAQTPGVHPGYEHAIRDLREAKGCWTIRTRRMFSCRRT
jgi:hypothetical protein